MTSKTTDKPESGVKKSRSSPLALIHQGDSLGLRLKNHHQRGAAGLPAKTPACGGGDAGHGRHHACPAAIRLAIVVRRSRDSRNPCGRITRGDGKLGSLNFQDKKTPNRQGSTAADDLFGNCGKFATSFPHKCALKFCSTRLILRLRTTPKASSSAKENEMVNLHPSAQGFIRLRDVLKHVPVGKSTIWNWVRQGKFPPPVKLSDRVTAWSVAAVEQWVSERLTPANDK